ncbi:MAG: ABC transporter permease subunit [Clostridia bacterium]|nr:ABC transporter permease subunit [Clostridia bacterium]
MLAIFKREVRAYFYSPIAYVLISLFFVFMSILFNDFLKNGYPDISLMFTHLLIIILVDIIVAILTMRVFAEDRRNGTEVLLVTSPIKVRDIVLGKYFAALLVYLLMVVVTMIYPLIMSFYGELPVAKIIVAYVGFTLLGATFISVGVFASSLTENQVVSAVISFITLLVLSIIGEVAKEIGGVISKISNWFSPLSRLDEFGMGILNFSPVIYYLSFIFVFLFFTILIVEKRRWSQG